MDGSFYFSAILDAETKLFLAELTDEEAIAAGRDAGAGGGYFLYEKSLQHPQEINILARVESDEAAFALSRMLNMTSPLEPCRPGTRNPLTTAAPGRVVRISRDLLWL